MKRYWVVMGMLCMSILFCNQAEGMAAAVEKNAFDFTKVKTAYCRDPIFVKEGLEGRISETEAASLFLKQMKALHISVVSRTDLEKTAQRKEGITLAAFEAMDPAEKDRIFEQYLPTCAEIMIVPQILGRKRVAFEIIAVKSQQVVFRKEIEAVLDSKKRYTQQELYEQIIRNFCRTFNRILVG